LKIPHLGVIEDVVDEVNMSLHLFDVLVLLSTHHGHSADDLIDGGDVYIAVGAPLAWGP
jgi:hypothetical protein